MGLRPRKRGSVGLCLTSPNWLIRQRFVRLYGLYRRPRWRRRIAAKKGKPPRINFMRYQTQDVEQRDVAMGKNVVIFSDGTGQAGGFRFDENRSNIYKLYQATRCGPDSLIDPREQVAFYDPGLGSQADGGHFTGGLLRWAHNVIAQMTGFGITRNIIDCYAALIQLWEPGDHIFLVGFSRGAYTVRCLAGVIAKCGIPRYPAKHAELPLRLDQDSTHALAAHAVKHIYQFTYPRKMKDATPHQRFLLDVREKLAKRFREDHGSVDPADATKVNAYPHFIGVFDTVAALGNPVTSLIFLLTFLAFASALGVIGWVLTNFEKTPLIGWLFAYLSFRNVFWGILVAAGLMAVSVYIFTHFKWGYELVDDGWMKSLSTIHFNELWMRFYDYDLNPNVSYARHAISIDENRKNFKRVPWYSTKDTSRDQFGLQWFEQVWFAGNHSDIGGSYPENEARLSDIALNWMLKWASVVPNGLKYDGRLTKLSPYPEGVQHDEVRVGYGLITRLTGFTWPREQRPLPGPDAIVHRSVYQRFDQKVVQVYDVMMPYRPKTLGIHKDFAPYYQPAAPFPANSSETATEMAEEPPVTVAGTKLAADIRGRV